MAVHQAGFLKDRLEEVLPSYMATSRRRVEFERKILARYAEVSQMNVDEMQVGYVCVQVYIHVHA